jgi:hypothetical protein
MKSILFEQIFFITDEESESRLTSIWLSSLVTDVTIVEEVLLFDFTAIVAAVGGSLGLFIGFSFLDVFRAVINKFS